MCITDQSQSSLRNCTNANGVFLFRKWPFSVFAYTGADWWSRRLLYVMQCRCNAVSFSPILRNRHPVARPWGRGMGSLFRVWYLIKAPSQLWCCRISCYIELPYWVAYPRGAWRDERVIVVPRHRFYVMVTCLLRFVVAVYSQVLCQLHGKSLNQPDEAGRF